MTENHKLSISAWEHVLYLLRCCLQDICGVEWESVLIGLVTQILTHLSMLQCSPSNVNVHYELHGQPRDSVYLPPCAYNHLYGHHIIIYGTEQDDQLTEILQLVVYMTVHLHREENLFRDSGLAQQSPKQGLATLFKKQLRQSTAHLWTWMQGRDPKGNSVRSSKDLSAFDDAPMRFSVQDTLDQLAKMAPSVSPGVVFPPPFLLVRLREAEEQSQGSFVTQQLHSFINRASWFFSLEPFKNSTLSNSFRSSVISVDSMAGLRYITLEHGAISTIIKHQQIAFSFSSYVSLNSYLLSCTLPQMVVMGYYRPEGDMSLGKYIQERHSKASDACADSSCSHLMCNHILTYSHYQYCISVSVETDAELDCTSDEIYMWTRCKICSDTLPVGIMSHATYLYSFGKFLELLYYDSGFNPLCQCEAPDPIRLTRVFRFKNTTVSFDKEEIQLYQIRVPQIQVLSDYAIPTHRDTYPLRLEKAIAELCNQVVAFYDTLASYIEKLQASRSDLPHSKVYMMLHDMECVFKEEKTNLLEAIRGQSLLGLNNMRSQFLAYMHRDQSSFLTWQKEYAPGFRYEPDWPLPEYCDPITMTVGRKTHLFADHGIIVRADEPTSIISFTLL